MESLPAWLFSTVRGEGSIFFFVLLFAAAAFAVVEIYRFLNHWTRKSKNVSAPLLLDAKVDIGWAIVPAVSLILLAFVRWGA